MKENERKFELKYLPEGLRKVEIQQGYLILSGKKHLRIRITDGVLAELGYKTVTSVSSKDEFEYEVPISDGIEMMDSTNIKLTKTRYKTEFQGNSVDIDIFPNGKKWVEIEFTDEIKELPDYCGAELTGKSGFNNITIALENDKSRA